MKVLVACEFSGVVRNAFLARGHDAWSCDLLPCKKPPLDRHLQCDVTPLLKQPWDLVIAHPPCTYLSKLNAFHLKGRVSGSNRNKVIQRRLNMIHACEFFRLCLDANSPRVCVENPVMMRECVERIGRDYTQVIHPWEHGHRTSKETCLWLIGLPELVPSNVVERGRWNLASAPESLTRGYSRSITYKGIAEAMADQWGILA